MELGLPIYPTTMLALNIFLTLTLTLILTLIQPYTNHDPNTNSNPDPNSTPEHPIGRSQGVFLNTGSHKII